MNRANCRSCGAPIMWAKGVTGRSMPLNVKPVPDGNVTLLDGVATVHPSGHTFYDDDVRYVSHFATCRDADAWRSPQRVAR